MNLAILDLYTRVKKFKGEWKIGDKCYDDIMNLIGVCIDKNKPTFLFPNGATVEKDPGSIWFPLTIDGDPNGNVEENRRWSRCLIGMIKGKIILTDLTNEIQGTYWGVEILEDKERFYYGATPTEALLKAIVRQTRKP